MLPKSPPISKKLIATLPGDKKTQTLKIKV